MANNLSLINNQKLTEILEYIKDEQTLKKTTASPEQLELLESYDKAKKSVKKRSNQAENDKVNFQNKRKKYKDYVQSLKENKGDDETEQVPKRGKEWVRSNVESFFKQHNVRKTQGGITIGQKKVDVNYSDLVEDLVTDNCKTGKNLTDAQLEEVLGELDSINFPAKYIRGEKLKKKYKTIKERKAKQKTPTRSGATLPPLPRVDTTPPTNPRIAGLQYKYRKARSDPDAPSTSTPKRVNGRDTYKYSKDERSWFARNWK